MTLVRVRSLATGAVVLASALGSVGAAAWLATRAFADVWRSPAVVPQAWGLRGWEVALDNGLVDATQGSLLVAVIVATMGCGLLLPAAAVIDRLGSGVRIGAAAAVLVPIVLPGSLVGLGVATFASRVDVSWSLLTVVAAHLPFVLAWQAVVLLGAWDRSVRARVEAAAVNGMSPGGVFRHVTVPGIRRAAALAWGMGFLVSWSQYATTLLVGGAVDALPVRLVPFVAADPQVAASFSVVYTAVPLLLGVLVLSTRTKSVAT